MQLVEFVKSQAQGEVAWWLLRRIDMKKLLCMSTLLLALLGLMMVELLSGPVDVVETGTELAEHAPKQTPSHTPSNMTELHRVIRQGAE